MKWSWKVGTLAGVDVYLHVTFLVLIAWVALGYWQTQGKVADVVAGVGFILSLFFCVLLHELGHALTARRYGIRTRAITLLPIGGIASIEKTPEDPHDEIVIALAGPAVSFAIAALIWLLLMASGQPLLPLRQLALEPGNFWQRLMLVNVMLGAFNLLPAFPMDGGRVLRATLALRMGPVRATRIAAGVAQAAAILLAVVGLYYNLFLLLIAIFIWFGAAAESSMATVKSTLAGVRARNAMLTDFHTLQAVDSLGRAVELTLTSTQKDFPVESHGELVGVLRQAALIRGLHDHGKLCRVDQVMRPGVHSIDLDQPLNGLLENVQSGDFGLLAVMDRGRLAGIIDLDNILELLRIQKALSEHDRATA